MDKLIQMLSAVIGLSVCTLVGATAAPTALQFPCNAHCTASVSLAPSNGLCQTSGACGIGIQVVVVILADGDCRPDGGFCTGECQFDVTLNYGSSCNSVNVTGSECGGPISYTGLANCGGPCPLHTHGFKPPCGEPCDLSYTITHPGSGLACSVTGTLTCGTSPCP